MDKMKHEEIAYTVFYRIHAPARTPKNPASGIPELAVSFLMRVNQAFMRTQLTELKWQL